MTDEASRGPQLSISTTAPTPGERRLALAVVVLSSLFFTAAAPFARTQLPPQPVFIAVYQAALAVNDLVTATLLFGQFNMLRSRALLVLGGGYLFTALVAIVHALTFPGLFAPRGLLGSGTQSTAWLYMLWHGVFPVAAIGYSLLMRRARATPPTPLSSSTEIAASVLIVLGLVAALVLLVTAGEPLLPAIMKGSRYTPIMVVVVSLVWALSLAALVVLWRNKPHTVLDLWLMVVMCTWLFDVGLSAVFNAGRFDLGFYVGRIYGLLASCFVLMMLLTQTLRLYAQLAAANTFLRNAASRDGLTGVFNRRWLDEGLRNERLRAARDRQALSLLLVDVDNFKSFNDTYGHVAGDNCLRAVAEAIGRAIVRPADMLARFGGEEFVLVLPATDAAGALRVAERAKTTVADCAILHSGSAAGVVTVSIGITTLWPDPSTTSEEIIAAADEALYEAKAAGRNRVAAGPHNEPCTSTISACSSESRTYSR